MPYKFAFYVHHHGSGHLMRCLHIASALEDCEITFIGSNLNNAIITIPSAIQVLDLPLDIRSDTDKNFSLKKLDHLHYSPTNSQGLRERNHILIKFFRNNPETLLIVDVSCEVIQLATLCGIRTIAIRQHGDRSDLAHILAYQSADLLLAPYDEALSDQVQERPFKNKTFYSGCFSRYSNLDIKLRKQKLRAVPKQMIHVGVFLGKGGTEINSNFIDYLNEVLPANFVLHVIGDLEVHSANSRCIVHGYLRNPQRQIEDCDVMVSNAGHNAVMEIGSLGKPLICIPADRPFSEQVHKANILKTLGLAEIVSTRDMYSCNWKDVIAKALKIDVSRWQKLINDHATDAIAEKLKNCYTRFYNAS